MSNPNEDHVVDKIHDLERQAAALAVGILGLKECSTPEAAGGLIDLAWDLSEKLGTVSEELDGWKPTEKP